MTMNRRELCSLMPALLLSTAFADSESKLTSSTFPFEEMHPHKVNDTAESRSIVNGTTPTGERVEVHQTRLNPGGAPHPPHRHAHSEFWLIKEGTVELTINGKQYKLGPGSAGFAASNDEHGIKNAGDVPAVYFVVAVGPMPAPKA
jgi:quercetin dioxygenase-like cupin family protein